MALLDRSENASERRGAQGDLAAQSSLAVAESRLIMKFAVPVLCSNCGCDFKTLGYGELTFPPATCPQCGQTIHIIDPLTISVVAERLLYRSQAELENGDFTMPIICSAMAIETALTRLFLKWKEIEQFSATPISGAARAAWETEYRTGIGRGGFANSANFVSRYLTSKSFDSFAALIKAGLNIPESHLKTTYIHEELFNRRNRIMHWGYVGYEKQDAQRALDAAFAAIAVLRVMDKQKADAFDRESRAKLTVAIENLGKSHN